MLLTMLKSKIHRATVTEADLNYVGSITIDETLLQKANILPNEQVQVVNNHNGARLTTYAIPGPAGSGVICLNGAAARLVQPGDVVIIMAFAQMNPEEANTHQPRVLVLDEQNQVSQILGQEPAGTTWAEL